MDTNKQPAPADDSGEAFLTNETIVPFAGERITVKPMTVLQIIQVSRALKQVLPAMDQLQELLGATGGDTEPGAKEAGLVVSLLADYGEPLTEGIAIAIGKPVDFVRGADDFVGLFALVAAVVRVNAGFFAQQAGPHLAGLLTAVALGGGPMQSTASSAPATH